MATYPHSATLLHSAFYPFPLGEGSPLDLLFQGELSIYDVAVYSILHYHCDFKTGWIRNVTLTLDEIAKQAGMSRCRVTEALHRLCELKLLKRSRPGSRCYHFHVTVRFGDPGKKQRNMPCPRASNRGIKYPDSPLARLGRGELSVRAYVLWLVLNMKSDGRKDSPLRGQTTSFTRIRLTAMTNTSIGSVRRSLAELEDLSLIERRANAASAYAFVLYPFIDVYHANIAANEAAEALNQQFAVFLEEQERLRKQAQQQPHLATPPPPVATLSQRLLKCPDWELPQGENPESIAVHPTGYLKKRGVVYARVGRVLYTLQHNTWEVVSPKGSLIHESLYHSVMRAFDAGHGKTLFRHELGLSA